LKKHNGLFRSLGAVLVLAACVASCDGAPIVAQDASVNLTARTIRGVIPTRIGNAMVTRINVIDAKTGRTVSFTTPNAQGAFTLNNVPKGSTFRVTVQAGRVAVPLIFPQAMGSPRKTNLFRVGTKRGARAGTLDGPIDVGTLTSTTEGQDEQLTPMNPMQAPNNQEDFDEDGMPDAADTDVDGDGTPNDMDMDNDGDGMPDNAAFGDQDGDGVTNESDSDMDGDGTPNEEDADNDNDGTPDAMDTTPNGDTRGTAEDTDGDGVPNSEDSTEADDGDVDDEHGDGGTAHEDASGHGHEDVPPDPPFEGCTDTPYEPANPGPHWSYMDQMEWPSIMGPDGGTPYSTCAGPMMQQTPIDLTAPSGGMFTPEENQLTFVNYNDVPLRILNNGHTVQVNVARSGEPCTTSLPHVMIGATPHCLVQFHGHTQSEHTVGGQRQPMEWHFVHSSTNAIEAGASLAVIGVFFNTPAEGAPNAALASLLERAPRNEINRNCASANINLGALLPTNRSYYHYSPGSLTTPGCTKGLNWFVLSAPVATASSQTTRLLERIGGHENYRNIQPLGARTIYRYSAP
jgi:carbonic anhydrase